MNWRRNKLAVVVLAALLTAGSSRGADEVNEYMSQVSEQITKFLHSKNESTIALRFTGPTTLASAAAGGDALTQQLGEKLKAQGIRVEGRTRFGISGKFTVNTTEKPMFAKITTQIVDADDAPVANVELPFGIITRARKISELFGLTNEFQFPPNNKLVPFGEKAGNQDDKLRDSFKNPQVTILNASLVKPSTRSPFAVEIMVGDKTRQAAQRNGEAYVALDLGEEYLIRLTNQSRLEMAAALTVDGLNVFHFSKLRATTPDRVGEPMYQYYVLAPGTSQIVRGWHIAEGQGQDQLKAFRVAPFEEGLAAKLGRPAKIGMITATFHASWANQAQPPGDEPKLEKFEALPDKFVDVEEIGPDGKKRIVKKKVKVYGNQRVSTTFGSDVLASMTGVKRTIGVERASITVRYERPDNP